MLKEKMIVKRTIALLLLLAMLVVPLTACQTKNSPSDTPASTPSAAETPAKGSEGTEPEEIVHLKMAVPFFGTSAPADAALISEKISEISRKEIGVEVELAFYSISDYYTQIPLILSGDEQLDCLASFGDTTDSWIRKGYLQPITAQVEQYGSGIKEVLGDWLNAGQYYGDQYVLGVRTDLVEAICFCMRKDIVDKYGIDLSQVKQLSDLADVFAVIKENEPDLIPMVASDAQSFGSYQFSIDSLFDNLGVLMPVDEPGSTEIKNFFATEKYRNYCEMLHDWYQKGYALRPAAHDPAGAAGTEGAAGSLRCASWLHGVVYHQSSGAGRGAQEGKYPLSSLYDRRRAPDRHRRDFHRYTAPSFSGDTRPYGGGARPV